MSDLLVETQNNISLLTLNRVNKSNAFDDKLLIALQAAVDAAIQDPKVLVLLLKAEGKHFSAGADLDWMQRMVQYSKADNIKDAQVLAKLMHTVYHSPKPTLVMVQGGAYGGGAGLVAACDVAIASQDARFCFSETSLGLIPAVISPFVVKAIGERSAKALFMSAEVFDAKRAQSLGLVHHCVESQDLVKVTLDYAQQIARNAPLAVREAKQLTRYVENKMLDQTLIDYTAHLIAEKRISAEGQKGLTAFLKKEKPQWD